MLRKASAARPQAGTQSPARVRHVSAKERTLPIAAADMASIGSEPSQLPSSPVHVRTFRPAACLFSPSLQFQDHPSGTLRVLSGTGIPSGFCRLCLQSPRLEARLSSAQSPTQVGLEMLRLLRPALEGCFHQNGLRHNSRISRSVLLPYHPVPRREIASGIRA